MRVAPVILIASLVTAAVAGAASARPDARPRVAPSATLDDVMTACAGDNPYFAVVRAARDAGSVPSADPAVVAFNDTPDDDPAPQVTLAHWVHVGSTYGLAYDFRRAQLYVGAYHKRGAPLGPGGPGQIYRIDLRRRAVERWATVDAGPDRHDFASGADAGAAEWVGRSALGDLELDEDGGMLFAVDLHDRRIHRFSVPDGSAIGSFAHGASETDWAADARPFALGVRDGWLYHGVVDAGDRVRRAFVYRSRADGTEMTRVVDVDLAYRRRPAWAPWTGSAEDAPASAQAMLVDIVFRPNGDPVIGLRDRTADMASRQAAGDVLPTRREGTGWQVVTEPEHYLDRWAFDESLNGALATMPGFDLIVASATAPLRSSSVGAVWFYNETGGEITMETVAAGAPGDALASGGLGDVELLCGPRGAPTLAPTPTPTATPTPTPTPVPAFLPLALRESCPPTILDVVLVIDLSTSMRQSTRDGRAKIAAALEAARTFIGLLDLAGDDASDRAALVGFNSRAWLEQALTSDAGLLDRALDRLVDRLSEHTRLDLAVRIAGDAALGEGHRERALPVVVLLTDGRPNQVPAAEDGRPETTVLRAAAAVREAGVRLYTVGLGSLDDVDGALLEQMAGEPLGYLYAPDGEDLAAVYRALAATIRCPTGRHDWGKPWR